MQDLQKQSINHEMTEKSLTERKRSGIKNTGQRLSSSWIRTVWTQQLDAWGACKALGLGSRCHNILVISEVGLRYGSPNMPESIRRGENRMAQTDIDQTLRWPSEGPEPLFVVWRN